ncbi:hypothetical protein LTR37_004175 [Vermiconidia calcicola]|uniref:Uncharacterized protein n=1 Tax=Vermiconidia calcicola TaxID=1690605 RepID=A0ACC3NMZ2_9PEZI|nr:hypothetical protein LTR37_004175 [Vermiconidia calcicola]
MKFTFTFILLAFLAVFAAAAHPQQQPVVVSYPKDTPQSVIDKAMAAIKQAGGVITHEYSLIKGFAAKASEEALDTIQSLGNQHDVVIEKDQMVHTQDD